MQRLSFSALRLLLAALLSLAAAAVQANANITIVNIDPAGTGFNDPTPTVPVGGNRGKTLGEQRLIAFRAAADLWGKSLDSAVEIRIQASFAPLPCTAGSAVVGAAGPMSIFSDFPGAEFSDTWYPGPLANKLAMADLAPGDPGTDADDMGAAFNGNLGQPDCLAGIGWYYGLDSNPGFAIDLVDVLLHEFAHGLGFISFVDETTGAMIGEPPIADIFTRHIHDNSSGTNWHLMSDAERVVSAVNARNVVWDGRNVKKAADDFLTPGTPLLSVSAPAAIAGRYSVGPASFGPPLAAPGVSGRVVLADGGANSPADACTALANAAAMAGNIALVDRGTCAFTVKVKNAQDAGAVAVLVVNNVPGTPPDGLGGADPTIAIPSARISLADGNAIKAQLASGVRATLGVDMAVLAGADAAGYPLLYTPDPAEPGSSVSHWDTIASPDLLMEPNIGDRPTHNLDLTVPQMRDIGWFPDADVDGVPNKLDQCPASNLGATVKIGRCDTRVPNALLDHGCSIADRLQMCAAKGDFSEKCVSRQLSALKEANVITSAQKRAILQCVAKVTKR